MEQPEQIQPVRQRVAFIGDVHGQADMLETALTCIAGVPALDAILCAGDISAKKGKDDTDRCCQHFT